MAKEKFLHARKAYHIWTAAGTCLKTSLGPWWPRSFFIRSILPNGTVHEANIREIDNNFRLRLFRRIFQVRASNIPDLIRIGSSDFSRTILVVPAGGGVAEIDRATISRSRFCSSCSAIIESGTRQKLLQRMVSGFRTARLAPATHQLRSMA